MLIKSYGYHLDTGFDFDSVVEIFYFEILCISLELFAESQWYPVQPNYDHL